MCVVCCSDVFLVSISLFFFFFFFFLNEIVQLLFVCNDLVFIVYTFYFVMYCVDICLH